MMNISVKNVSRDFFIVVKEWWFLYCWFVKLYGCVVFYCLICYYYWVDRLIKLVYGYGFVLVCYYFELWK